MVTDGVSVVELGGQGGEEHDAAETCRDFARFVTGNKCAVFVASPCSASARKELGHASEYGAQYRTVRPFCCAAVPNTDFLAASNRCTVANFGDMLRDEMRRVFATDEHWTVAVRRIIQCIGTRVVFQIAVQDLHYAAVDEPTFCIVLCPSQDAQKAQGLAQEAQGLAQKAQGLAQKTQGGHSLRPQVYVTTFAFVRDAKPASRAARTVLRIQSPDLLGDGYAEQASAFHNVQAVPFKYTLFAATHATVVKEALADLDNTGFGLVRDASRGTVDRGPVPTRLVIVGVLLLMLAVVLAIASVWAYKKGVGFTRQTSSL